MSIHPLSWVLRESDEKLGRRLVLIVLADHAHEDGTNAWPSVPTIAHEARLSVRQVQNCLSGLAADGAIELTGVHATGTKIYRVVMGGADFAGGAIRDTGGVQSTTSGGADIAPEPSLNRHKDPSIENLPVAAAPGPPKLVKVDGRDVPFDALALVCGIADGSNRLREVALALNGSTRHGLARGIRALAWQELCDSMGAANVARRLEHDPARFEKWLAVAIGDRAARYQAAMPGVALTPMALAKWWTDVRGPTQAAGGMTAADMAAYQPPDEGAP